MAQLVRNKETGEYGLYSPDTGVQPISQDEAQVLQQSAAGNIARSVGGALTDAAGSFIEFTLPTILNADGTRRPNLSTRLLYTYDRAHEQTDENARGPRQPTIETS